MKLSSDSNKSIFSRLLVILTLCFMLSEFVVAQKTIWKVETIGAMREMFSTGNIDGKIQIDKIADHKNLYALGPLENLSGEIMIWSGVSLVSFVENQTIKTEINPRSKAVFFVWTKVENWDEINIPSNIKTYDELEEFVAETANKFNLDSSQPFPFLLKGVFPIVEWHINDYKSDGTQLTHEKHDLMKLKKKSESANLEMLGFYSSKHKGIFTHHTRNSHIHATDKNRSFIGHVDDLSLNGNIKLFLPK